jgi:hypothetical protein
MLGAAAMDCLITTTSFEPGGLTGTALHSRDGKEEGDTDPAEDRTGSTPPGIHSPKCELLTKTPVHYDHLSIDTWVILIINIGRVP